jgi:signal transduction histidine kinase
MPKYQSKHIGGLLALLLCAFFFLVMTEHRIVSNREGQLKTAYVELQRTVIDKQLEFIQLYQTQLADTSTLTRKWSQLNELANKRNISIFIYSGNELYLWTSNSVHAQPLETSRDSFAMSQSRNAYQLVYQVKRGQYTFVLAYVIKTNFAFRNQYIQNQFSRELGNFKDGVISHHPMNNMVAINSLSGVPIFYIQLFSFTQHTPVWLIFMLCITLGGLVFCIHLLARKNIRNHPVLTSVIFLLFWLTFRMINTFYHLPDFVYQLKLFSPVVYASSAWLPSLGDLAINSVLFLWLLVILESGKFDQRRMPATKRKVSVLIWFAASVLSTHFSIEAIKSLIIDSQISFEISNILVNDQFIYICLLTIVIQLLSVYFIVRNFTRSIRPFMRHHRATIYIGILAGIMSYIAVAYQFLHITSFQLGMGVSLFVLLFGFKIIRLRMNRFQQYFIVIFIICAGSALSIHHWVELKELENRKLFAVSLISQNDITTDYFLRNVEKKLIADPYVLNYFQNPLIIKAQFEKRIRQIYFTGYLSKYEVNVLDYEASGYHFRQRNILTYQKINELYHKQSLETINTHFRYIRNSEEAKGYIAKFVIRNKGETIGILFILLKPKLIQDENRFDDLLIEGFRTNKKKDYNYSYAIYKDKFLIHQSGNFPYRTNNTWGETQNAFRYFKENGYDHIMITDAQPLTVVVSKPRETLLEITGLFSFLYTCCTILLILVLFIHFALNAYSFTRLTWLYNSLIRPMRFLFNKLMLIQKPETLYIRTRIQTSIIFILFITLLFTSFFTINFITGQYNNRQTERLMKKMRNVVLTVENENIHTFDWENSNELEAFINQIADFYDTDINIYNKKGEVKASSISKIYDEGIVGKLMSPIAFYHLSLLRESQFTQDEGIAALKFQAAYAPVFRNKTEVLGYIQLPYFSQKADLLEEIASIVVGFINLYVLLFILIGIIAYLISRNISYPLIQIQQKLAQTVFIGKNEPIVWQRDDEIGELVKQYNAMIAQLEASAQRLAETEREGAWREIARQVAHEIKNPLTPMKLSIQHLQRAFKNNDPDIAQKVDRTTQLFISQIDTLSDLASEFSSYAKMPLPVYELIDAGEVVMQIRDLYNLNEHLEIELKVDPDCTFYFDSSYLNRIVGNLVKNAIQSIPENQHGKLTLEVRKDNDSILISVKDNGKGMSASEADKIFTPYFSTKVSGLGLGLPIVKSMVESGRGRIEFHSVAGEGTTFLVTLPVKG